MDERALLGHLEALAETLGVQVRYEDLEGEALSSPGGLCRIRGRQVIMVNKGGSIGEKAGTLARALRRFDLSKVYVRPALRDLLEGMAEKEAD